MSVRVRFAVFAALVWMAIGAPAQAAPLLPGDSKVLASGDLYSYTTSPALANNQPVNDEFFFSGPAGLIATTTLSVLNPTGSGSFGVKNLTVTWLDTVTNSSQVLPITNGTGLTINLAAELVTVLTNHLYKVTVTGMALARGGIYNISVAATPLPPALILFGSALAGLGLLGRRRRRTSSAPMS